MGNWNMPGLNEFMDENHKDEINVIAAMGKRVAAVETSLYEALELLQEGSLPFAERESRDYRFRVKTFLAKHRSEQNALAHYPTAEEIVEAASKVFNIPMRFVTSRGRSNKQSSAMRIIICGLAHESEYRVGKLIARDRCTVIKNRKMYPDRIRYDQYTKEMDLKVRQLLSI